jgi:predicted permease
LSVSNAVLLRPPVARNPERLVTIHTVSKQGESESFSYPDYEYIRDHSTLYSGVAGFKSGMSKAVELSTVRRDYVWEAVSDNYFSVMGIRPYLGQLFSPGEDRKKTPSAILTYAGWQRWGANPKLIGQTISINNHMLTIIGVGPKEFRGSVFALDADVIVTLATAESDLSNRDERWVLLVARTKPGVTRPQVRAEVQMLWKQLANAYPQVEKDRLAKVIDTTVLPPDFIEAAQQGSAVLVGIVLLILLVACANVASLLLALATRRRQEALIKAALGATRFRLLTEFLRESALLCVVGGVLGYVLAAAALHWVSVFDASVPGWGTFHLAADLHPGPLVVTLTVALIAIATFASGLAPALYASSPDLAAAMSGEIVVGGTRRHLIRNTVVVIQVAISTLALIGVGLCYMSLERLRVVDPGFSARNLVDVVIPMMNSQPRSHEQQIRIYDELRQKAAAIGGVESVTLASEMPLLGGEGQLVSFPHLAGNEKAPISSMVVDERYFSTMGIRVLSGRTLSSMDQEKSPWVIMINQYMAEKYWPHESPIGKAIRIADGNRLLQVVGVVANGKYEDLDEDPRAFFYFALNQHLSPMVAVIARTSGDPLRWLDPMARLARSELGGEIFFPANTWQNQMNLSLFIPKFILNCVTGLTVLALLLATIGLYGAISYSVSERRKELGIRVALGAMPPQLFELVLRRTLAIAGIGVAVGLGLGVAASSLAMSMLYGIHPVEWDVLVPVAGCMLAVAAVIAYLAARPWIRMDAMEAVRHA